MQGEWEVTEAMIVHGGGFVSALGALIRKADVDNKKRLIAAFPEYIEQYKEIARLRQSDASSGGGRKAAT